MQVLIPQHAPWGRPGFSSLIKNTPRTKVTPKKGKANDTETSPIAVKVNDNKVDFLNKNNIGINEDENCNLPTTIPFGKKGFISAGMLPPDYPLNDYKVIQLTTQTSLQRQHQSKKVVKNKEVSSQQSFK